MADVLFLNDKRYLIQTVDEDDEDIICEYCNHEFKPGEKYVQDTNLCAVCPDAAGGLSDKSCYANEK